MLAHELRDCCTTARSVTRSEQHEGIVVLVTIANPMPLFAPVTRIRRIAPPECRSCSVDRSAKSVAWHSGPAAIDAPE
jgi:hypothetical protein